ncbi:MAG: peptidyl-alpha-hydroxyglycine alpha-amidating lyase family protein [Dehalococcoidia bacterium]|jgi:DNA-binding beta-propeller fold protein YncE|nr:peptidyl-alpha-hydroxyglycine alpha-amidating lyase family protein [Dehalococcoidia bacterium]
MVTNVKLGSGQFTYEVVVDWEKLPQGYRWREVAGVIADSKNNVYVFNRGDHPMMVFDSDGNFVKSWGEGVFTRAHGVTLGPDDTLYCTDDGDHTVRQCTLDGEVLMTIGVPGQPAGLFSGEPFNRCTHVALDPDNGDLFVSDGYGNSRVHKYTPDGKLIKSWGEPGTDAGQFNIAHNIATDRDGYVYVADRENHRIQVFDRNGNFETMWANVHRPCGIFISDDQRVYVGELGWGMAVNRELPNIGPRISVLNTSGKVLARLGAGYGLEPGQFIAPHGICLAPDQSIYVGEVAHTSISHSSTPPDNVRSFQKLAKVD